MAPEQRFVAPADLFDAPVDESFLRLVDGDVVVDLGSVGRRHRGAGGGGGGGGGHRSQRTSSTLRNQSRDCPALGSGAKVDAIDGDGDPL